MAKYLVTSGSYFEPFTYEQLSAPIREAAAIHRATQDTYDQIGTEAEALRRYIEQEPDDSNARHMYDSYMTKLSDLQNNLWSNGYNAQTRRDLSAARAGYASDISRLGTAIQTRQKRSAEYWKTRHDHPDMIMGNDPGLASLDNYLADDLYGQNYYNYSGKQFAAEVGDDIQTRAAALLKDPRIERNPELFGYLTRITEKGITDAEINNGLGVIRSIIGDEPSNIYSITPESLANLGLDMPSMMVAQVLLSHLQASGAAGKVSNDEFNKLVGWGAYGASKGIMAPDVKDFNDILATNALELSTWKQKQNYSAELAARAAAQKKKEDEEGRIVDHYQYQTTGRNARKVTRQTKEYSNAATTLLITKDGKEVRNNLEASELVYSGAKRREAAKRLGFDAGEDPNRNRASKFLQGEIVDKNGRVFQTRFNPKATYNGRKGVVQVRTGRGSWGTDPNLTEYYYDTVKEIEATRNYYENNEPKVYALANIDPDKQAKDYEKQGVSQDVPLTEFRQEAFGIDGNGKRLQEDAWVARYGTDPGEFTQRVTDLISSGFSKAGFWRFFDSGIRNDTQKKQHRGTSEYIHKIGKDGKPEAKVASPDDVFKMDKNGKITNLESIRISPESVERNCIIVKPHGSDDSYTLNIDMLNSTSIDAYFEECRRQMQAMDAANEMYGYEIYDNADKYDAVDALVRQFQSLFGYDTNTQTQGGSAANNPYLQ